MEIPSFNLIGNILEKKTDNKSTKKNTDNILPDLSLSIADLLKIDTKNNKKSGASILPLDFNENLGSNSKINQNPILKNLNFDFENLSNNLNIYNTSKNNSVSRVNYIKEGNLKIPSVNTIINGIKIHIEPKALQQIMRCETYVPPPGINIKDGAGVTVGYGHTATKVTIRNKQDAVYVLADDVKKAIQDKFKSIPTEVLSKLSQNQLNALASVAMNVSSKGFKNFAPVRILNDNTKSIEQRIEEANTAFMSKLRKGFKGLVWRRANEALMFSGIYVKSPNTEALKTAKNNNLV